MHLQKRLVYALRSRPVQLTLGPALLVLACIAIGGLVGLPMPRMLRDPASMLKVSPLVGVVSNMGGMLWFAAVVVCMFTASCLRGRGELRDIRFMQASAVLSFYLFFDDYFMFHEYLAPNHLRISEDLAIVTLGVVTLVYLTIFARKILETDWTLLFLAFGFLGTSVVLDKALDSWINDWKYFAEDGPKWLGIACWCGYFVQTSHTMMSKHLPSSSDAGVPTKADEGSLEDVA